ncbi:hypothetical protein B0T14DRAFT_126268 [Immersiella caudata]|uniref:Uncharacterized protein n=1 Tax=Immersiella caudata TaxID=314043 RepID=A0AA39X4H6_9PEZI|nr:hypothetical protein B0T14DRAFT_126268 [Immersiella caudata]
MAYFIFVPFDPGARGVLGLAGRLSVAAPRHRREAGRDTSGFGLRLFLDNDTGKESPGRVQGVCWVGKRQQMCTPITETSPLPAISKTAPEAGYLANNPGATTPPGRFASTWRPKPPLPPACSNHRSRFSDGRGISRAADTYVITASKEAMAFSRMQGHQVGPQTQMAVSQKFQHQSSPDIRCGELSVMLLLRRLLESRHAPPIRCGCGSRRRRR